jgi:hypothetical protein
MNMAKTVALTAVGGMVVGIVGCGSSESNSNTPAAGTEAAPSASQAATKACCKGNNDCKGKGNCKVEGKWSCKGQNDCKGKGGCHPKDCTP